MATPDTTPVSEPMVAMLVVLLVHTPPPVALVCVEVAGPTHAVDGPRIGPGDALTVTAFVVVQPVAVDVKVIVVVPVAIPVTTPLPTKIVATEGVLLTHVPAPELVRVIEAPTHNADGPPMGAGGGLTTMTALSDIVRVHPVVAFVAITV